MKKLVNCVFLILAATTWMSCMDDDDPYWYFRNEPAIVQYKDASTGSDPMIQTAYGLFLAPTLDKQLEAGQYLWTSFNIDMGNQPSKTDTTVSNLRYQEIGGSVVKIVAGDMTDAYSDSVRTSVLYNGSIIGNVYFFGFEHYVANGKPFEYEIICNTDSATEKEEKLIPTLYIRTKPLDVAPEQNLPLVSHYGFDMTEFINLYKENGKITFNIKYKAGTYPDGKDKYKPFLSNPITLPVR